MSDTRSFGHATWGQRDRTSASPQQPQKPIRYMIPYQWTLIGPSETAIGLMSGCTSMTGAEGGGGRHSPSSTARQHRRTSALTRDMNTPRLAAFFACLAIGAGPALADRRAPAPAPTA